MWLCECENIPDDLINGNIVDSILTIRQKFISGMLLIKIKPSIQTVLIKKIFFMFLIS